MKLFKLLILALLLFATPAKAITSILLIGDSITYGIVGGPDLSQGYEFSFGQLLITSLGSEYSIINRGCGGAFSREWTPFSIPRQCYGFYTPPTSNIFDATVIPVDIAVVMLGTNDAGYYPCCPSVASNEYQENVRSLVFGLLNFGIPRIILMSPPPRPEVGLIGNPQTTAYLSEYRDVVMGICAVIPNVYCIDVLTAMTPHVLEDFWYGGPIGGDVHPNATGHAEIHQLLHDKIITLPEPGSLTLLGSGIIGLAFLNKLPR